MDQKQAGKTFVISGATSGIGLATAKKLASQGLNIIGIGRSPQRCSEAREQIQNTCPGIWVEYVVADLSSQNEVRRAAREIEQLLFAHGQDWLDGLINVAGTFTFSFSLSVDGIEMQWALNHLASFLLTWELLPFLQAAPNARVVTVSSDSHYGARIHRKDVQLRRGYFGLTAYMQSKLANVLFTQELNRRYGSGSGLRAFAADPGLVKTDIALKGNPALIRFFWKIRSSGGVTAEYSAQGVAFLASDPSIQERDEVYWKDGKPRRPSRQAEDLETARWLWEKSEEMCGIKK